MKYWVYKDAQILGPLAKEDLGSAGGLRPETLVCAEDSAGGGGLDWRCAEEVADLSTLCAGPALGVAEESLLEPGFGVLERLRFDTTPFPGEGGGEEWLSSLFDPGSRIPESELPKPDESARQELAAAQDRVKQLTDQINLLNRRLAELEKGKAPESAPTTWEVPEKAPGPFEPQPKTGAPPLPLVGEAAPPARPAVPAAPAPKLGASGLPTIGEVLAPQDLPEVRVAAAPAPPETPPPLSEIPGLAPAAEPEIPSLPPAPAPGEIPADAPPGFTPPKGRPRRVVKISAPKSFRAVRKDGSSPPPQAPAPAPETEPPKPRMVQPPLAAPATAPYKWNEPSPVTAAIPQAGAVPHAGEAPPQTVSAPPEMPALQAPPPINLAAPPPAAQSPFMAGLTAPPQSAPPQTLEAPPVPSLGTAPPTPGTLPPMTMAFSGGAAAPAAPPTVAPPPPGGPTTQEVLAKLAKPQPSKTIPPQKPRNRVKPFLIIIGTAAAGLLVAGWFFLFHNAKDIKTVVNMDSGRPPVGAEVPADQSLEGPALKTAFPARPPDQSPPVSPVTSAPPQAPPAQPQTAAPAPRTTGGQADIRDERPAAIDLVKNFPLDGDRGTVGAWLQYSFAASPGAANTEKWDAGAVEESIYYVQYTVQPSGDKIREAITYLFEADVARRTVRGKNGAARELLAGGPPTKPKPVQPKRKALRKRVAAAPPKEIPLLPLPSDSDLMPPSDEESAFRSDTIQPNL